MTRGFVSQISSDGENTTAVIILENKSSYIVPIEMLPRNIEIDDFVIINNGVVTIDPTNLKILLKVSSFFIYNESSFLKSTLKKYPYYRSTCMITKEKKV